MIEALAEGLAGLLGSLIVGWRSALGLCCGFVLACIIVWAGSAHSGTVWMVAALALVLGYGFGLGWEFSAKRGRRIRPNYRLERSRAASSVGQEMISAAQVEIYERFDGDIDKYQRRGSPQRAILGDAWKAIEDLRRRLFLVAAGRASVTFARSVEADFLAWTLDEDVRRRIRAIVESDVKAQSKS